MIEIDVRRLSSSLALGPIQRRRSTELLVIYKRATKVIDVITQVLLYLFFTSLSAG